MSSLTLHQFVLTKKDGILLLHRSPIIKFLGWLATALLLVLTYTLARRDESTFVLVLLSITPLVLLVAWIAGWVPGMLTYTFDRNSDRLLRDAKFICTLSHIDHLEFGARRHSALENRYYDSYTIWFNLVLKDGKSAIKIIEENPTVMTVKLRARHLLAIADETASYIGVGVKQFVLCDPEILGITEYSEGDGARRLPNGTSALANNNQLSEEQVVQRWQLRKRLMILVYLLWWGGLLGVVLFPPSSYYGLELSDLATATAFFLFLFVPFLINLRVSQCPRCRAYLWSHLNRKNWVFCPGLPNITRCYVCHVLLK